MAIVTEAFDVGGRAFIRTYSDAGRFVVRDSVEYVEACDPAELGRTYTEGDVMPPEAIGDEFAEAGRILMGVDE